MIKGERDEMRKCIKCGNEVKAGWAFCPVCGGSEFLEGIPIFSEADDFERYATVSPLSADVREDYLRRRFPQPEGEAAEEPQSVQEPQSAEGQPPLEKPAEEPPRQQDKPVCEVRPWVGPQPQEKSAEELRREEPPRQEKPAGEARPGEGQPPQNEPTGAPQWAEKPAGEPQPQNGMRFKPAGKAVAILGSFLALGLAILGCIVLGNGLVEVMDDVLYGVSDPGGSGLVQFREMLATWLGGLLFSIVLAVGAGGFLGLCCAYLRIRRVPLVSQLLAAVTSFIRRIPGELWIVAAYVVYDGEHGVRDMVIAGAFVALGSAYIGGFAHRGITEGITEGRWNTPASPDEFAGLLKRGGLSGVGKEIRLLAHCALAHTLQRDMTTAVGLFGGPASYSALLILLFTVPDGLVSMAVWGIWKRKSADGGGA